MLFHGLGAAWNVRGFNRLKFIRQLPRKLRDELMTIEMMLAVNKAVLEQTKFFRKERPFQDVIRLTGDPAQIDALKERRAEIGRTSGLCVNSMIMVSPGESLVR